MSKFDYFANRREVKKNKVENTTKGTEENGTTEENNAGKPVTGKSVTEKPVAGKSPEQGDTKSGTNNSTAK